MNRLKQKIFRWWYDIDCSLPTDVLGKAEPELKLASPPKPRYDLDKDIFQWSWTEHCYRAIDLFEEAKRIIQEIEEIRESHAAMVTEALTRAKEHGMYGLNFPSPFSEDDVREARARRSSVMEDAMFHLMMAQTMKSQDILQRNGI